MPAKPKPVGSKIAAEHLRATGFRPVQYWVPDLRNPQVLAQIRRQAAKLDKHPEMESVNAWLDAALEDVDRS